MTTDEALDKAKAVIDGRSDRLDGGSASMSTDMRARMTRELRPHQIAAIDGLRGSLVAGRRRPVLQAPTGFGKTLVASAIVSSAMSKGKRVVFVVPALSLIDQTVEMFWQEGVRDVGVIQADHRLTDWSRPVQVASIQTLMRRNRPKCDLVLVDECHRWFDFMGEWMADPSMAKVPFVGLSATPWTRGLGKHYDDLVIAATTSELIGAGYLSPFRVFAPGHPDLKGVRTVAGDYHEGDLSERMDKPTLVADIVTTWQQRAAGLPTLVFGVDRAHAKHISEQFTAAGVPTAYMDAFTTMEEREPIRKGFADGSIKVVCNVGVLTTGIDWDVRCIVLARPTKSEILFVQIIGRGLRTAPGKEALTVLDHSDTHLRLGLVTDIQHDRLDDGRERQKAEAKAEPTVKECKSCAFIMPRSTKKCPNCGFEAAPVSGVVTAKGELVELRPLGKKGGKAELTTEQKARFYGELLWIAKERGYASGWSANQFRSRTSVWPNHHHDVRPIVPSAETRSWVKSQQIRYAKGRWKADVAQLKAIAHQPETTTP